MHDAKKRNSLLQGAWGLFFLESSPVIVVTDLSFCPVGYSEVTASNMASKDLIGMWKAGICEVRNLACGAFSFP